MPVLVTCKFNEDQIKIECALSVAMQTKVLIVSVPNAYTAFPPPQ